MSSGSTLTIDQAVALGIQHHNAGQLQQAEQIYQQILQQQPNHPDALHLLGLLASQSGNLGASVELIARAIKVNPASAIYHSNLGEVLRKLGLLDEAEAACRRAVKLTPDFAPAHANLGVALYDRKQWREAETSLRHAVELDGALDATTAVLRAHALLQENELDRALEIGRRAPSNATTHNCLGTILEAKRDFAAAESEFRKALGLDPRFAEAMRNMGLIEQRKGNLDGAMDWWQKTIAIRPDHADANWNLALGLLTSGDFERGWPLFEWRFRSEKTRHLARNYPVPRWSGFEISGKTLLLYGEQGFGDMIQFARFIPQVAARGAKVVLQVPFELVELMKGLEGLDSVVGDQQTPPPFDAHQSLLSLPLVLGTTLKTLPAKVPYIGIPSKKVLPETKGQWKVGLVWTGRPAHAADVARERSIPLQSFSPLTAISGVKWFSLQKGPAAAQCAGGPFEIVDLSSQLNDFTDTASAIAGLDLVIGIDSAVIHLAGALGARVWTLLPLAADFRWMLDREDSPWYPTMRLFRQRTAGDWNEGIQRVGDALKALIA